MEMFSPTPDCGVCRFRQIKKESIIWCSECDEGLCNECEQHHKISKGTRQHVIIPFEEYKKLPSFILQIKDNCMKHDEKYQLFCKTHDSPCCRKCNLENHKKCKDVAPLEDIIQNVKSSTSFQDLENQLKDILKNIEQITQNRRDNAVSLNKQRKLIEKEFSDIRKKMNNRLDLLQERIVSELADMEGRENGKIEKILSSIDQNKEEIKELAINMGNIRKYSSDMQAFMGKKHIEAVVAKHENYVHKLIDDGSLDVTTLSFKMNKTTQQIFESLATFGNLTVEIQPSKITSGSTKPQKAIKEVANVALPFVENHSLKLDSDITTGISVCGGCYLLSDGRIILTSYNEPRHLFVFTTKGIKDFSVDLKSRFPTGVTSIGNRKVAVAVGMAIKVVDLDTRSITRSISTEWSMSDIEYREATLICCAEGKGIVILDLTDESVTTLVEYPLQPFSYVTTHGDNIYFTDGDKNKVICCETNGKIVWEFQDKSLLENPQAITIDSSGRIYIAGFKSQNVVKLSPDGKQCKEILSRIDGVLSSTVLHCDKASNKILVANKKCSAYLYNVVADCVIL